MRTKIFFLLACLLLLTASCATQKQTANTAVPYVYYTGDDAPAASAMFRYADEQ
jgi:uncharacterized lipoprotein YajG